MIKYLDIKDIRPEDIPAAFAGSGIGYTPISRVNWPGQYPYKPEASFGIAYTDSSILIHYKVREEDVRAFVGEDKGQVWTDSCVEFFFRPDMKGPYYNIECNCIGKILVACGPAREGRETAPDEVFDGIRRWASLGNVMFDEKMEETSWEIALVIPFTTFFRHEITNLEGVVATANFFKCGGSGRYEHYLSWAPIFVPTPDYHRPDFFREIHFERR